MPATDSDTLELSDLFRILKKRKLVLVATLAATITLAIAYVLYTPDLYSATAKVLIDPGQGGVLSEAVSGQNKNFESAYIDSQVEVVKSRDMALTVLKQVAPDEYLSAIASENPEELESVIQSTLESLQVRRVDLTYVISFMYTSTNAEKSALLANAFAENYILSQINALKETSGRASDWIQLRIEELRQQSMAAQAKVDSFRQQYNLYDANGQPIDEEQIKKLNDQLGEARANVATAKARYEYSREVIDNNDVNAAVAEALDNDVINSVRTSYLQSKKKYSELNRILGDKHAAVIELTNEIKEYETLILGEMDRIAQSQLSAFKIAVSRERELEASLESLFNKKTLNESKINELSGLVEEALVYSELYSNYLENFQQLSQQKSFPISESRIIAGAVPPLTRSHPKPLLIIAMAIILGGGLGALLVFFLEFYDKKIYTEEQIKKIGLPFLGYLPKFDFKERRSKIRITAKDDFKFSNPVYTMCIDQPFSIQAETMRRIRARIDINKGDRDSGSVIGVISCFPEEGKSITAANLALTLAKNRADALLLDADVRNPTLSEDLFEEEPLGLGNILSKEMSLSQPLLKERRSGLNLLPNLGKSVEETMELMNGALMQEILEGYKDRFEYVIVDLPPLDATSEAFCFSQSIDHYLVVCSWKQTNYDALKDILSRSEIKNEQIIGAVINFADVTSLTRYHGYQSYSKYNYITQAT